jgi:hypothetical protein
MPKKTSKKNIFISFIEEGIMNPTYHGYIGGRIEVSHPGDIYPSEEIRFFTKDTEFYKFRDEWDMKNVALQDLRSLKRIVKEKYYDFK